MRITFHGGECCGVKSITNIGTNPDYKVWALPKTSRNNSDKHGDTVRSDWNFFTDEAPTETAGERFDRYLRFLEEHRPGGIVEVILTDSACMGGSWSQMEWAPFLEGRGFKKVSECLNSNSNNNIHVFHLVMKWVGVPLDCPDCGEDLDECCCEDYDYPFDDDVDV